METVDRKRQGRYVFLLTLITVCASLIVFILILVNQFGYFNVTSAKDNPFVMPKVAIVLSDYNFDYFKENRDGYQENLDQWYKVFKEFNIKGEILRDKDLETGPIDADILVLPSTVCMSDKQISNVKKYVKAGGGLIISWAAGSRRAGGSWRDWSFIEDLANVKMFKIDKTPTLNINFLTVNSRSPITTGIPSGLRIDLKADKSEILARGERVDSFYSDWRLFPIMSEKGYPPYLAITHAEYGKGKVVWFSFNTNRLLLTKGNRYFFSRIVRNTISWMMDQPVGNIDNWPYPHKGAFFIDEDTEHEPQNALVLGKIMAEENAPGTFFCISSLFEKYPHIIKQLPDIIEIGSHLDSAANLKGNNYETQLKRIGDSKRSLEKIRGKPVVGLKPAEEVFDANTIKVLMKLGFKYMVANPETPLVVPTIIDRDSVPKDVVKLEHLLNPPEGNFVLFPRIAHDDYYIMVYKKILDNEKILSVLKADFQNIYNLGGIYIFAVHTQLFSLPQHSVVERKMIRYAKEHDVWIERGRVFADWWLKRSNLTQNITKSAPNKFDIRLTSSNQKDDVKDVGLTYYLPRKYENIRVTSLKTKEDLKYGFDEETKALSIHVPLIKAMSKERIEVSFEGGTNTQIEDK